MDPFHRHRFLDFLHQLINHCCVKFRRFELLRARPSKWTTVDVGMRVVACIEWPESHDQSDIDALFWTLYGGYAIPRIKGTYDWAAWAKGKFLDYLGHCLDNFIFIVDKVEVPHTKDDLSRVMKHLRNSVEYDGDIDLSQMLRQIHPYNAYASPRPDARCRGWRGMSTVNLAYVKTSLRTRAATLSSSTAKCFLVDAMVHGASMTILFLSSKYLSNVCKAYGEYCISLKALSLAYKTCHHEDDSLLKYKKKAGSLKR